MKFFLIILCIGGIIFTLTQLPVITGGGIKEVKNALDKIETVELSGKTLFISDLHLTARPALEEQFNLDFSDVQNVVIVGDFFNQPKDFESFGNSEPERMETVLKEITPQGFSGKIFFIFSAHSHDPRLKEISRLEIGDFEFVFLGEYGKFLINGKQEIIAFHGGQLHEGIFGGGIAWLAKKIGQEVVLEKLGKKRFDIPADTWVVSGHSHVPGIDQASKVANTGSFVGAPLNTFIFRIHVGSGILFDKGKVELLQYEGLNIKKLYPFSI